jgi:transposase, IS5 family
MPSQSSATPSLFSFLLQDKGGRRTGAFLDRMDEIVPWQEIGDALSPAVYDGAFGRPGFPTPVLVKALLLQAWYGLSDPELEEQILDRVSFQRFLGVVNRSDIPDETTVCRFRNKLVELGAMKELFETIQGLVGEGGLVVKPGTIVDATIIEAPRGRKREDGSSTRDRDAGFTKKNGRTFHGYKVHVATDASGRFVRRLTVTSASAHDSTQFGVLTEGETDGVFGDKAYGGNERKRNLRAHGVYCGILDRAVRGRALSGRQEKRNRQKSSVRAHVEHPFAWVKRMGYRTVRYRGLVKNTAHAFLVFAAYALKRLNAGSASIPAAG